MQPGSYLPVIPCETQFIELRGTRLHARIWGPPDAPLLFLLHGWQDFSGSFQFFVDALQGRWRCIAPDWRGFGLSQWNRGGYWFPDYVADLDGWLDHFSPQQPVRLVGHSMGGNVLCVYAGIRPQRVARMATLEGFGLPGNDPEDAPGRYAHWLDQMKKPPENRCYSDPAALARRLQRLNPRLTANRAAFLAEHFGTLDGEGWRVASDPYHKVLTPFPYRLEEAKACWRRVSAPVLWVEGEESTAMMMYRGLGEDDYSARWGCFQNLRRVAVADAGHNLHHDQPERLAQLIEEFMA
jgi:pimeloyl-ACP methyl ester carboxylesterase